ncbi:MAG: YggS family pyridoxal phosphate-dependent enzyme [Acholeplasmatales bacterium]
MSSILGSMSKYLNLVNEASNTKVVVASKYMSISNMQNLYNDGARDFGENRADELLTKIDKLPNDITWHFIGSLQTNKVKKVINRIDYLHSLDRISLAKSIQKYRIEPLNCFIQINFSKEKQKSGIFIEDLKEFMNSLNKYDKIRVVGFMAMGVYDDLALTEKIFSEMLKLKNGYKLSMGMSNDYKLALKYKADYIRIGSLLKE